MNKERSEHWSRFWKQGYITTFGASLAHNYDGPVRAFWTGVFGDLAPGTRILDIATGNGAVATLAAQIGEARGRGFEVTGSDIAEISEGVQADPATERLRRCVDFHSHAPCESLPFGDDAFDLAVSQFGFEYSDRDKALAEIRRVLRPEGRFVAICHHADSGLIRDSRRELEVYRAALDEFDLFERLQRYFVNLGRGSLGGSVEDLARAQKEARAWSEELNTAVNAFQERFPADECSLDIVGAISGLARRARELGRDKLLVEVEAAGREFAQARRRLSDMVHAALDAEAMEELARAAEREGFSKPEWRAFRAERDELAGWAFQVR